jgi:glycosyltransferase involved in cell wall biosynthesis
MGTPTRGPSTSSRPKALLVTPSLQGHRRVYCAVIADLLIGWGYAVAVAAPPDEHGEAAASPEAGLREHGLLRRVSVFGAVGRPEDSSDWLAALTEDEGSDITMLLEADEFVSALAMCQRHGARAMRGRLVGLFIRSTNYVHHAHGNRLRGWVDRVFRSGVSADAAARALHEGLKGGGWPLDAALVLDERFAELHPRSHQWMPDIFRVFSPPGPEDREETAMWSKRLGDFVGVNDGRPVVVYVGTNQERRGYDTLLELALESAGCFIHCGLLDEADASFDQVSRPLRGALKGRGALLETRIPYRRPETAELFMAAARCVVLPYQEHDGSSGIMLQAAAAGRPVLVPDRGLMAWRVRRFGLGETYAHGDITDLRRKFRALLESAPGRYSEASREYAACFSAEQVAASIKRAATGEGCGARLPQECLAASVPRVGGPCEEKM